VDDVFTVLRVVVSLAVVVGVIWFVQRKFVRGGGGKGRVRKRAISIVARQSVGRNSSVAVVEFQGKQFLLGVTEHGISVLDQVAEAATVEEPAVIEPAAIEPAEPTIRAVRPITRRASSKEFAAVLTGMQVAVPESVTAANIAVSAVAVPAVTVATSAARAARTRTAVPDALVASLKRPAPGTPPLTGSILSGATWKQAFSAIKGQR
jgi:flagellar protein FliO/FliZ